MFSSALPFKERKRIDIKMVLFPGHNYLGPGNDLNSGKPVDVDDLIAQEHDIAYESARNEEDVFVADRIAILRFIFDCIKNKNWHSAIGAIGLSLKHGFEKLIRKVVYPRLDQNCRENEIKMEND
jgi:hypothetical protein